MAFSSEVTAKLGVDASSVPKDMARARQAFVQEGKKIENEAGKHGTGAGDKFVHGFTHKLTNAKHLSTALATALGLNIHSISEQITSAIVGGSREAWEDAVKLADRNTAIIERLIETRMSPKQVEDKRQKDLNRAIGESEGAGKQTAIGRFVEKLGVAGTNLRLIGQAFGLIKTEATLLTESQEASLRVNEADLKVAEEQKKITEAQKSLEEARAQAKLQNLEGDELVLALNDRINDVVKEIVSGQLSEVEIREKKKELIQLEGKIAAENLRMGEKATRQQRELNKLEVDRFEAQRRSNQDQQNFDNARADRGKTTLGELAELRAMRPSSAKRAYIFGEDSGLSDAARAAKATAREIQDMEAEQTRLRLSGDVFGATALADQISTKRDTLVQGGFLKSTEGDEFKQLKETLHDDNVSLQKILTETKTVLEGKFVNQ